MPDPQMVEAVTFEQPMCGLIPNADLPDDFVWSGQILKPIIDLVEHNVAHVIEDWIAEGKTMEQIAQNTTAVVAVITARLIAMSMSGSTIKVEVEGMSPAIQRNFG